MILQPKVVNSDKAIVKYILGNGYTFSIREKKNQSISIKLTNNARERLKEVYRGEVKFEDLEMKEVFRGLSREEIQGRIKELVEGREELPLLMCSKSERTLKFFTCDKNNRNQTEDLFTVTEELRNEEELPYNLRIRAIEGELRKLRHELSFLEKEKKELFK